MQLKLIEFIQKLTEEELTNEIIIPLIEKIHPGKIEYTHSANEAGRDLVSFGSDLLNRPHILCAQIKAKQISYGASFGKVQETTKLAKEVGVTIENGSRCLPHEVWFITSYPFPEQCRRQVAECIQALEKNNIKFISGEELCKLLIEKLPEVATKYSKYSSTEIVNLISSLLMHKEGRAFGFSNDKSIIDFYVTATLSPQSELGYDAIAGNIDVPDDSDEEHFSIMQLLKDELTQRKIVQKDRLIEEKIKQIDDSIIEVLKKKAIEVYKKDKEFLDNFNVKIEAYLSDNINGIKKKIKKDMEISIVFKLSLNKAFLSLVNETKKAIDKTPSTLKEKNVPLVRKICNLLMRTNNYVEEVQDLFGSYETEEETEEKHPKKPIRIRIPEPKYLLEIDRIILIKGPPGCGKTTLLKMLAIDILNNGEKVLYIPCFSITPTYKKASLKKIVENFSLCSISSNWELCDIILILDGLDEAPFNLSQHILRSSSKFANIVISSRNAYDTSLLDKFFQLNLVPFTKDERTKFFKKWFEKQPDLFEKAMEIIDKYPDIEEHTKLPLIATIVVSLLQNGLTPKTRAEVYDFRLNLLLSNWDRLRGVRRLAVDNPDAKRRFLRHLAYTIHALPERRRTFDLNDIQTAYEFALGRWGYNYDFPKILDDLIVGSGIIIKERPNVYSFGHLTFQEHLAGEYINTLPIKQIVSLMGDDWWREPLNFYASICGNINDIIDYLLKKYHVIADAKQLNEMLKYAPFTSPGAIDCIKECLENEGKIEEDIRDETKTY